MIYRINGHTVDVPPGIRLVVGLKHETTIYRGIELITFDPPTGGPVIVCMPDRRWKAALSLASARELIDYFHLAHNVARSARL